MPREPKDEELDSLRREAGRQDKAEAEDAGGAEEGQYIEAAERRLKHLLKGLGQLPYPLYCDSEDQAHLAEVWAPLAADWNIKPGGTEPAWVKWTLAIVGTTVVMAPKAMAAYYMAQSRSAGQAEPADADDTAGSEDPAGEPEGDDGED